MRELDGGKHRFIEDAHIVMLLKRSHQSAHHDHALRFARLLHFDHLEATGQGRILLKVLFVFGPCRGGNGAQLTTCQCGLQQVGGVVLAGLSAGADHGVCFIDEQNDGSGRSFYFFDQALETIFEFALHASPCLQQRQVERSNVHVLERRRHIALCDAQCESLDNRGLPHARFAGEDGIVLPATGENVDDLANLRIAPEDRIDFPLLRIAGQVDGVLVEIGRLATDGLGRIARACGGTNRRAAGGCLLRERQDAHQILAQSIGIDLLEFLADVLHQPRKLFVRSQGQHTESGANRAGIEIDGANGPCRGEHLQHRGADGGCARVARLQLVEAARKLRGETGLVDFKMLEDGGKVVGRRVEKLGEEVLDLDVVVSAGKAKAGSAFQGGTSLIIQLCDQSFQVQSHLSTSSVVPRVPHFSVWRRPSMFKRKFTKPESYRPDRRSSPPFWPMTPSPDARGALHPYPVQRAGPRCGPAPVALQNPCSRWKRIS